MSDSEAAAPPQRKAKGAGKPKKPRTAATHPKVSEMVTAAITSLKERGGSSLQAIKKYIGAHYKVDLERLTPFVKKYLRTAVASGVLVQTKGKGATGSFRVNASGKVEKGVPKKAKRAPVKKPKPAAKKPVAKPKKVARKPAAPKKKAAKSTKKPQSKPKSPKPKKAKPGGNKKGKKGGRK